MIETVEVELKLDVDSRDVDTLLASAILVDHPSRVDRLDSVYFDTPDHAVRRVGFSIRVRHIGDRRVQTIKAVGAGAAGLFARPEWEEDISGDRPVFDLAKGPLLPIVDTAILTDLQPVFRTTITRDRRDIRTQEFEIEFVLDRGMITAGDRVARICEIELELKRGEPSSLFAIARQLDAVAPMRLGVLTKSERGYRLARSGESHVSKVEPVELVGDISAAAAFQAIAHSCLRQFRLNEAVLHHKRQPASLHQARVGLRRLRSALSLFKTMLAGEAFECLRGELRWIAGVLGDARNLDVLIQQVDDNGPLERLRAVRDDAYARVSAALASARLRAVMLELAAWISVGDWIAHPADRSIIDEPISHFSAKSLDRHRRKLKRLGAGLAVLDDQDRHEVRIAAKKLRYAAEFFSSLYSGKKTTRRKHAFLKEMETLQSHLGDLNDLATASEVLSLHGIATPARTPNIRTDASREGLLAKAAESFETLLDTKPFWR